MKMASTTRPFVPLLVALALFGAEANANLMSVDYVPGSSDGWITYDTSTGLEWLDVSLTVDMTFDQVRTGDWYAAGFRYASRSEVETLFRNAGTPDDGFDPAVTYSAQTLALAQLLGPTLVGAGWMSVSGFLGTDLLAMR